MKYRGKGIESRGKRFGGPSIGHHDRIILMMRPRIMPFTVLLAAVLSTTMACRPVLTIGWGEIGIFMVLLLVLLGPALFRFFKRIEEYQKWKAKKKPDKETD